MGLNLFRRAEDKKTQPGSVGRLAAAGQQGVAGQQTASGQPGQGTRPQQTVAGDPGSRMSSVFDRMYILVASVDLDSNSCFVESSRSSIGDTEIPRRGYYDAFAQILMEHVDDEDKVIFAGAFDRMKLTDIFMEGRSCVSEMIGIDGQPCEIRAERIREKEPGSTRARCCVYIRQAESCDDNGRVSRGAAESDRILSTLFISSYEICTDKDMLIGYEANGGIFVKSEIRYPLRETVDAWIADGTVHKRSAADVQNFYRGGFLRKKTVNGQYMVELLLRDPGSDDYRWYEDVIVPFGTNFRVYRRDIDEYKKLQEQHIREEEQEKMFNYNQSMLCTLASVVEFRNEGNRTHIAHVSEITRILLEDVAERSPQYRLDKAKIRLYAMASTIHDIGKVTIPDSILNKPGRLTPEEREIMMTHAANGASVIESMRDSEQAELYDCCADIALHHHERYDGRGYPGRLSGDRISIAAQAVAVADAYDALVSVRCYKKAYPFDEAYDMIVRGECGAFNPRILESLRAVLEKIRAIYSEEREQYARDKVNGTLKEMTPQEVEAEAEIKTDMAADHSAAGEGQK